ncbi:hypothetical protein BOO86_04915 [Mycobacterium sp. CBMA 234]|uniref:hypothetical protein n=1 Tax=Mycolicibacterium sp. CBMA 234 TaxID=1918495 RepID=UPI0012DD1CD6|nr:hypothetical protein [Mycolicibacterium sp. CBMA 234]MUL63797.1 hypothetical protein [Mycolicibacterium sp. CBMA 234]
MDLMWSVIALTVGTFTVLLAVRRVAIAIGGLVYSRYVAVGGLAAFSVHRDSDGVCRIRFEAGGPAVFHNVGMQLLGVPEPGAGLEPPALRHTMAAGDAPIEWTFRLSEDAAERAWVTVTWVRPYLQGVESEALAQWLRSDRLYEWRWYSETTRFVRTAIRFVARRWSGPRGESMRELPLYGRWRRTSSFSGADLLGPAATPPPRP